MTDDLDHYLSETIVSRLGDWAELADANKIETMPVLAFELRNARDEIVRLNKEAEHWRDLAQEGWSYATEYQQAKWLDKDLLDAWFPDNTERVRFYDGEAARA